MSDVALPLVLRMQLAQPIISGDDATDFCVAERLGFQAMWDNRRHGQWSTRRRHDSVMKTFGGAMNALVGPLKKAVFEKDAEFSRSCYVHGGKKHRPDMVLDNASPSSATSDRSNIPEPAVASVARVTRGRPRRDRSTDARARVARKSRAFSTASLVMPNVASTARASDAPSTRSREFAQPAGVHDDDDDSLRRRRCRTSSGPARWTTRRRRVARATAALAALFAVTARAQVRWVRAAREATARRRRRDAVRG